VSNSLRFSAGCNHAEVVDLALVIWPRERPVHTLKRALYCGKCLQTSQTKRRPDLIGLRERVTPDPTSPGGRYQMKVLPRGGQSAVWWPGER
jgi:hypothetical protein